MTSRIGTTALSEETCGPNTDNSGRAIGLRYCSVIYDEECESRVQQIKDTVILEQCPENWHGHSGYCYYLSHTQANFNGARDSCSNKHSSLASIHGVGDQVFLQGLTAVLGRTYLIGLHDSFVEGEFQWIDETEYNYHNWNEYEPNNAAYGNGEDCVTLIGVGGNQGWWNDVRCYTSYYFKCKKRAICNFALGMESGRILDSQLSASSMRYPLSGPTRARLNQSRDGVLRGAWTAILNAQNQDQWIQVIFFEIPLLQPLSRKEGMKKSNGSRGTQWNTRKMDQPGYILRSNIATEIRQVD
ncbi:CD209 antigen-like protein 2 [Amphiura filiformis]|uniref:CD209 antigen-like protein 2 n=1 Tax=Amphiura filiformis TaxID=82378 RepID=UPI003B2262E1